MDTQPTMDTVSWTPYRAGEYQGLEAGRLYLAVMQNPQGRRYVSSAVRYGGIWKTDGDLVTHFVPFQGTLADRIVAISISRGLEGVSLPEDVTPDWAPIEDAYFCRRGHVDLRTGVPYLVAYGGGNRRVWCRVGMFELGHFAVRMHGTEGPFWVHPAVTHVSKLPSHDWAGWRRDFSVAPFGERILLQLVTLESGRHVIESVRHEHPEGWRAPRGAQLVGWAPFPSPPGGEEVNSG